MPRRRAINPQQNQRANDRKQDAPQRESAETAARKKIAEEAAQEGAHDADQHRDQDPARIATRHDRFRDRARDETKHDPRDDTHTFASIDEVRSRAPPVATDGPKRSVNTKAGPTEIRRARVGRWPPAAVGVVLIASGMHDDEPLAKPYDPHLMRRLAIYLRPYGWLVASALGCLMVDGLLQLVGPIMTRRVIDVALPARDIQLVWVSAALFGASLFAAFVCQYGETILTQLLGQRVMRDLRREIFGHVQRLPVVYFDRNPVGRTVTRVTSDVEALNELFTAGVVSALGDLFTLLAISALMLTTDWRLALAAFFVIPFVVIVSRVFQNKVRDSYRDIRARVARINAYLQEHITGMRVVQLFGREPTEAKRFDELNRGNLDANLKSIVYYALYFPAIELLTSVALASLIVAGARRVEVGTLTVGTVAAFLQLVRRFFQPLQDLSDKFNTLQQAMAAAERVFRLLDEEAVERWSGGTVERWSGGAVERLSGGTVERHGGSEGFAFDRSTAQPFHRKGVTVEFDDVWFAYDLGHVARE